jgi:site-specific DNA recombinase
MAEQLGALVIEEFIDAGESARSADRPELQQMLRYLIEHPGVRYVIVHKVDRLARNRVDDVEINLAIRKAGATLVSCTENIDETPSGMLLHGIMSSIAEFYSRNLANEVIKGTEQKVKGGGTPTLAPLGYLNTREIVNGRETRTVIFDPDRAELVRFAFVTYATGDWSLNRLARELELLGLTQRATAKRVARPVHPNKLQAILRNRYYIGCVTWRGMEYEGRHPKLVDPVIFQRVQEVLTAHALSGERSYRRRHYLAGSLFCGRCGSRMLYSVSTGRRGDHDAYWCCLGRHRYKNGCDLPYLAEERVEHAVEAQWLAETTPQTVADSLRDGLLADLADYSREIEKTTTQLTRNRDAIERERLKWAEQAMSGVVPGDIARDKQQALAVKLAAVEEKLAAVTTVQADHEKSIRIALRLVANCGEAYARSSDATRRAYNQAWFEGLYLDSPDHDKRIARVERSEVIEALRTAEVRPEPVSVEEEPEHEERPGSMRYRVFSHVRGSNVPTLVELRGFEPLTLWLPAKAGPLRHRPCRRSQSDPIWSRSIRIPTPCSVISQSP